MLISSLGLPPIQLSRIPWPIWWDSGGNDIIVINQLKSLDFPTMLAQCHPSRRKESWPSPAHPALEVQSFCSAQLGWSPLGIHMLSVWRTLSWVEGLPQRSYPLHLVEDGDLQLEGEEHLGSCVSSSNVSGYGNDNSFVTLHPGVGKEGKLKSYLTMSFSNKFASVTLWSGPSTTLRRR